jgi:hypothetical protein
LRRWLINASPEQFILGILAGFLAFLVFSILFPYLLAAVFVLALVLGGLFMQVGGVVIGAVSFLERTGQYDPPAWYPYMKWGTAPMRLLDSTVSLYELFEDDCIDRYRR